MKISKETKKELLELIDLLEDKPIETNDEIYSSEAKYFTNKRLPHQRVRKDDVFKKMFKILIAELSKED